MRGANVIRWLIAIFLILMIFGGLHRWLEKIGSSVLLSVIALALGKFF